MKRLIPPVLSASIFLAIGGTVQGQTVPQTMDSYLSAAKAAAGTDWAGTFLRLCIPSPPRRCRPASREPGNPGAGYVVRGTG
jgi:hypothetical protein